VGPLLIRADASAAIGAGHVMRCLALAQAWQDAGGRAVFVRAGDASPIDRRLAAEGIEVERLAGAPGSAADARETEAVARRLGARWVVVDGYHLGDEYERALKEEGLHLLAVDDCGHAGHGWADLVLNQNIHARAGLYPDRGRSPRLLLGPRYALLRREFRAWRNCERAVPERAGRLLVTLGGSDPDNATLRVLRAVQEVNLDGMETEVLAGAANPHREALERAAGASRGSVRLTYDAQDMPARMAAADVAVAAGGSTSWELAYMGLPSLVLVLAENQRENAAGLAAAGIAVNLGEAERLEGPRLAEELRGLAMSRARRQEASRRGRRLVDGQGAVYVVRAMREVEG
jgi:UDP-2,4-diacetamido-2,4,6-trideoxy-beta-L-altropyranose hydrolase